MTSQRQPRSQSSQQHILLLGATGESGLAFIKEHLSLPDQTRPFLTIYIRSSSRSKLYAILPTATDSNNPSAKIRIVEGSLVDKAAIRTALSASTTTNTSNTISTSTGTSTSTDDTFPKVTTVISVLGAYMSLYHFLTRTTPTPIGDAFNDTIVPAMRELHVSRILVLSTPCGFTEAGESSSSMSWGWWIWRFIPAVVVPQANAEMKAVAEAVLGSSAGKPVSSREALEATVFRVPVLTNQKDKRADDVVAFVWGDNQGMISESRTLSRQGMVRWLLREVEDAKWVGRAPVLCDK